MTSGQLPNPVGRGCPCTLKVNFQGYSTQAASMHDNVLAAHYSSTIALLERPFCLHMEDLPVVLTMEDLPVVVTSAWRTASGRDDGKRQTLARGEVPHEYCSPDILQPRHTAAQTSHSKPVAV